MRLSIATYAIIWIMSGCGAAPPILVHQSSTMPDDAVDAGYDPLIPQSHDATAADDLEEVTAENTKESDSEIPAPTAPAPLPTAAPQPTAAPRPQPPPASATPTAPVATPTPAPEAKYGVGENLTCQAYVASHWKVGAYLYEEYKISKFVFTATLTMRTTVTAVSGSRVTVRSEFDAPDTENDTQGEATFDACTEGWKSTVPNDFSGCAISELGFENVRVNGTDYRARKTRVTGCRDTNGKTLDTTVWRVPEVPLWGIIKREATGTYIPDKVDGKLAPTTKQFSFN